MLIKSGFWVVPSYDFSGTDGDKAPKMIGVSRGIILPDLDVCKDGRRLWVEVKTKLEASFYRRENREEHGFDKRHFSQYLEIQEITGCKVVVVFYETKTGRVLRASLEKLNECKRSGEGKMSKLWYFPVSAMKLVDFSRGLVP